MPPAVPRLASCLERASRKAHATHPELERPWARVRCTCSTAAIRCLAAARSTAAAHAHAHRCRGTGSSRIARCAGGVAGGASGRAVDACAAAQWTGALVRSIGRPDQSGRRRAAAAACSTGRRVAGGFARRYARGNPTETAAATARRRLRLCTTWAPPRATIGHCRCAGVFVSRRATGLAWRAWSCGSRPRYGQARLVLCAHSCVLALSCTSARKGEQARVLAGTAERPPLEDLGGPSRLRRERAARIVGRERLG
jgi:hypothetical protein